MPVNNLGIFVFYKNNQKQDCIFIVVNLKHLLHLCLIEIYFFMKTYNNLVEATSDLMARGYSENLTLDGETVDVKIKNVKMKAEEFEIDEFYRFEGESNPDDMSIIYAVSSSKFNLKGILVNAFGTYADTSPSAVKAKLFHHQVGDNL